MVRHPGPVTRAVARARAAARWLAAPPETLRRGPLRAGAFPSPLRSARLTSQLGVALGAAFAVCFVTGVFSHLLQHPPGGFAWPSRPAGLYRVTQGLHVATGLATVPLLGVKLWSVYPRLFAWPPVRGAAHAAERLGVLALVAGSLFLVVSGVLNVARWYAPMPFFFTAGHHRVAWLTVGALLVHLGVQLPVVRGALRRARPGAAPSGTPADARDDAPAPADEAPGPVRTPAGGLSRRALLGAVGAAAGVITVSTVGQTVAPLSPLSPLAPRRPGVGPQGLPVNKTAAGAGVRAAALDPAYRLVVQGPRRVALSLADLAALPQHTVDLPIACVEGWSATGRWTGVRLRDLVALAGVDPGDAEAVVESLEPRGRYRRSTVAAPHLRDPATLVALRLRGEPLALDHGYPARLIAPNRPGVLQTKWLSLITVRGAA